MAKIQVDIIRGVAKINGKEFPMYCGFLSAVNLKEIAEVPSFSRTKPHHQIATDISHLPVDQWQRPLDAGKSHSIKDTYSRHDKDNLMANPVLIGIAKPNIDTGVYVDIQQKVINGTNGVALPVNNLFSATVNYSANQKPLWILDGQHRLEGMSLSQQKDEPIPFVLLYDDWQYTPPFLAEIFTQVTTGATPMESLHADWMKYAFRLEKYAQSAYAKSMDVTISLCTETTIGNETNPFQNKVQFNPYLSPTGYYAFAFNEAEWTDIVAENYYSRSSTLAPQELASEIVKATRALEDLDQYRNNGSKLFSTSNPHKILAEAFLGGLLKYLSTTNQAMSLNGWKTFFQSPGLKFNSCRWDLPFVRTTGALSSGNGQPSKTVARECFDLAFNDTTALQGAILTDYLQGVKAAIRLTAFSKTPTGRLSYKNPHVNIITPGTGLVPIDLSAGGIMGGIIKIEQETPNCYIIAVNDPSVNPPMKLSAALKNSGLDISGFNSGHEIEIISMSYSGDTTTHTKVRLDK